MQVLLYHSKTIATLVNYTGKSFVKLTPGHSVYPGENGTLFLR